jgi:PhnB protein
MPTKALKKVPDGMNTVTTELWFNGNCLQAIDFYQKAFGAELAGEKALAPDGKSVLHAMMKIGDSNIMMADAWPGNWEKGPDNSSTAGIFLYVENCDELYNRALSAGCEVVNEMMDAFWGDRMGKVKDPYGHCWSIASHKWDMTPEEIAKGQEEWLKSATV